MKKKSTMRKRYKSTKILLAWKGSVVFHAPDLHHEWVDSVALPFCVKLSKDNGMVCRLSH